MLAKILVYEISPAVYPERRIVMHKLVVAMFQTKLFQFRIKFHSNMFHDG